MKRIRRERLSPKVEHYPLWNAGYVRYWDHMGDDLDPIESARLSTGNPTGVDEKKDDGLRDFLWRHKHTSVFEQIELVVEVQIPIFIERQVSRHRTFSQNQHSGRYSEPFFEYYIPDFEDILAQSEINKQSSDGVISDDVRKMFITNCKDQYVMAKSRYYSYVDKKISKEMARIDQPLSAYTRIRLKANVRNWFHFLSLRLKPNAQKEIREMANAIYSIIKELWPKCSEVFEEYTLYGENMSRKELEFISSHMIQVKDTMVKPDNFSDSHWREFKEKIFK